MTFYTSNSLRFVTLSERFRERHKAATLRLNRARHLIISAPFRRMVAANGGI
jgi:hypothetical protein